MCGDAELRNSNSYSQMVQVAGAGPCLLPYEFAILTGALPSVEVHDARESPGALHARLAAGAGIVLCGPYDYVNAIFSYCKHYERGLVARTEVIHAADRAQRSAAFAAVRRRKLHRLLLVARGDCLIDVQDSPDTTGLQEWLEEPTGDGAFLIPLRRLQRILTDMRRAREGIAITGLEGTITICPHVYVPSDRSVPAMFAEYGDRFAGKRVLDMGTGTGVLALLAAQLGAAELVATDSNPMAVENARINARRLGLADTIQVRGPADLFASVEGETFDVILFNAPWVQGEPRTLYDTAIYDPGYRVIDGFMREVSNHLVPGGVVLLQYSDISQRKGENSMTHLDALVAASGLRVIASHEIRRVSRVLGAREHVFLFEIGRSPG